MAAFKPQTMYWCSMGVFSLIEVFTAYGLLKGIDDEKMHAFGPANRAIWKGYTSNIKKDKSARHMLDYYALWVGNNKLIMVLLANAIGFGNAKVRFYGSISMTLGCLLYFYSMNPLLQAMQKNKEVSNPNLASKTANIIGFFLVPMWLTTSAAHGYEIYGKQ
eukprot:64831_1